MALDPDDSRPPYQQVGSSLRASILTKKPGFETGDKLPSGPELAKHFGVARGTVDKALDLLRTEGLIVTRQGSGSFVRERTSRPVGLRPHLEAAFEQEQVTLDFAGFSSETLHNALQEPLDKVRLPHWRRIPSLSGCCCRTPRRPWPSRCSSTGSRTRPPSGSAPATSP